ncbi:MAG: alpha/beta fold hydrolase [Thiobacillus sp.]|nr:alpha/beta fold hydrolase [Thiobacillus sp.]
MNWNPFVYLTVVVGMTIASPTFANVGSVVEATLPTGKIASASFQAGDKEKPALLVLHGFLQTRAFPTVVSVIEAASSAGYASVAPTLTLGISKRNKSLPCEALHMHTLQDDAAEVAFWVRWLEKKGYSRVILVGHSYGNLQLLAYLDRKPPPAVKQVLMISLTDVERKQNAHQRAAVVARLRSQLARGSQALVEAELGHCRKYVSPPAALLSYESISRDSILASLANCPVPAQVIMGSKDDRMGPDWVDKLVSRGLVVQVIPGASHFFDNQYEFDLQEAVVQALQGKTPKR